jgi:hypothetical protein
VITLRYRRASVRTVVIVSIVAAPGSKRKRPKKCVNECVCVCVCVCVCERAHATRHSVEKQHRKRLPCDGIVLATERSNELTRRAQARKCDSPRVQCTRHAAEGGLRQDDRDSRGRAPDLHTATRTTLLDIPPQGRLPTPFAPAARGTSRARGAAAIGPGASRGRRTRRGTRPLPRRGQRAKPARKVTERVE